MDVWAQLLQTFGLAVTILFAVGVAIWKGAGWFGREIIIPIRDKVISRVVDVADKLEMTLDKVDRNVDKMGHDIELMMKMQGKQTIDVRQAAGAMKEVADVTKQLARNGGG